MSDLIQEFRKECKTPTLDKWRDFYYRKNGKDLISAAAEKTWNMLTDMKKNLNEVTESDVYSWIHDLIIDKTYSGLQIQQTILEMISESGDWRLSTPEEESKGIDGVVDGEYISIKPHSYKSSLIKNEEDIQYRIIFYKETRKGLVIYDDENKTLL